ncbi:MAG: ABC transporter substrate-binding protein [Alkalispirochaeta sp.]
MKLTRIIFLAHIIAVAVCLPATLFATGTTETTGPTRTVVDALEREVTVPTAPQRIVTAGRAVLMIADVLYAFEDAPERLVGVGRISQGRGNFLTAIDPDYGEKTILAHNVGPEQIAAEEPDLVILKTFMRGPLGRRVENLGIPVIYVELETPQQYQRDITMLGTVLDEEERARELTQWYSRQVSAVESQTRLIPDRRRPETLLVYYRRSDGEVSFQVPPATWIQTELVERAGGVPVWRSAAGSGWGTVSFEQIAAWNPNEIMLVSYDGDAEDIRNRLAAEPRWQELFAVREDRFHAFPMDFYSWDQPDTRWILGLQWIARTLHPEMFSDTDMETHVREFYHEVYGLNDHQYEAIIAPLLTGDVN